MDKQIIVYEADKDHRIEVKTDGDTVWLTQEQMCQLFGRTQPVIARHIANVFKEGELPKEGFMQILHKTSQVGGRPIAIYNLDVVISVGYRVKSFQGTRFRQWATRVLREMLLNRLDEVKRIGNLERRMDAVEGDIRQIKGGMNYLVKQLSAPPDPPRKRIGFGGGDASTAKPYGKKRT
jgi:hypothetical protein